MCAGMGIWYWIVPGRGNQWRLWRSRSRARRGPNLWLRLSRSSGESCSIGRRIAPDFRRGSLHCFQGHNSKGAKSDVFDLGVHCCVFHASQILLPLPCKSDRVPVISLSLWDLQCLREPGFAEQSHVLRNLFWALPIDCDREPPRFADARSAGRISQIGIDFHGRCFSLPSQYSRGAYFFFPRSANFWPGDRCGYSKRGHRERAGTGSRADFQSGGALFSLTLFDSRRLLL
jgi:hypothetical protein